jgi:hypothetical protein
MLNAYGPEFKPEWCKARLDDFKKFYGLTPAVLTDIWHDMMTTDISLQLTISDKSDKGLTSSWWPTIFFGHTRKNSKLLASTFKLIGKQDAQREELFLNY